MRYSGKRVQELEKKITTLETRVRFLEGYIKDRAIESFFDDKFPKEKSEDFWMELLGGDTNETR